MIKDFAIRQRGHWRDGELPKNFGNVMVSYDQSNRSYDIDDGEWGEFLEWVALTWQSDNEPLDDGEDAQSYLDRRGVSIRRIHD